MKPAPGIRFGRWLVVEYVGKFGVNYKWKCQCDCGTVKDVFASSLRGGRSVSCGCYHKEKLIERLTSHGGTGTPEHGVWKAIKDRCFNPNATHYARYGGRGITMCERWNSFENFLADMGPRTSPTHTIERNDNNGNYEPGNCRWATRREQSANRSTSKFISANGKTQILAEWARELGVNEHIICHRLKSGWTEERAVTTPLDMRHSHPKRRTVDANL